jgi:hypothetical protein
MRRTHDNRTKKTEQLHDGMASSRILVALIACRSEWKTFLAASARPECFTNTERAGSVARSVPAPARFEQEPGAALRLVDPDFYQAGGCDVAMVVAHVMRFA